MTCDPPPQGGQEGEPWQREGPNCGPGGGPGEQEGQQGGQRCGRGEEQQGQGGRQDGCGRGGERDRQQGQQGRGGERGGQEERQGQGRRQGPFQQEGQGPGLEAPSLACGSQPRLSASLGAVAFPIKTRRVPVSVGWEMPCYCFSGLGYARRAAAEAGLCEAISSWPISSAAASCSRAWVRHHRAHPGLSAARAHVLAYREGGECCRGAFAETRVEAAPHADHRGGVRARGEQGQPPQGLPWD